MRIIGFVLIAFISLTVVTGCKTSSAVRNMAEPSEQRKGDVPLFTKIYAGGGPPEQAVPGCETLFDASSYDTRCGNYLLTITRVDRDELDRGFKRRMSYRRDQYIIGDFIHEDRQAIHSVRGFEAGKGDAAIHGIYGGVQTSERSWLFRCRLPDGASLDLTFCFDKLETLVTSIESFIDSPNSEFVGVAMNGRPIEVDESCEVHPYLVLCEEGFWFWSYLRRKEFFGSRLYRRNKRKFLQGSGEGPLREFDMTCKIPNAKVDCYGVSIRTPKYSSPTHFIILAIATDPTGRAWHVQCFTYDDKKPTEYREMEDVSYLCPIPFTELRITSEGRIVGNFSNNP